MASPSDPRLLAADPHPLRQLEALGRSPAHRLDDGWFAVGRPDDVEAILGHPAAGIGFRALAGDRCAALQARMARFSDGEDHRRRRAETEAVLAPIEPEALRASTARFVSGRIPEGGAVDLMALARRASATVLSEALSLPDPQGAVDAVALLARRLAPATGAGTDRPEDASVVGALDAAFGPVDDETTVARIAVLFQAMDATAALVAHAVTATYGPDRTGNGEGTTTGLASDTEGPPLILTTRTTTDALAIDDVDLPAGAKILVLLGAAGAVSAETFTFGRGPHRCPGQALAEANVAGVLDGLSEHREVTLERDESAGYEPRPNLRIPRSLFVQTGVR